MMIKAKKIVAAALVLSMTFAMPVPQTSAAEEKSVAADNDSSQGFAVTHQPKRLFAKAVKDFEKVQKGELKLAVKDLLETDVYYEALTDDEKLLYDAYAELYSKFDPFSSSDEFHDKAQSGGDIITAFADDILSGKVIMLDLSRQYTKEERQEMYSNVEQAYRYDHPYDQASFLYKIAVRIDSRNTLYLALTHFSKATDFDYKQWVEQMVQFEDKALNEIVSDSRYDPSNDAVKEFLVHDYICSRVKYDDSKPADNTIQWYKIKGAYGPMVEDNGVCIGISKMAKILLDDLGVTTYIVTSDTHAWNMVCIEGEYYDVDCTWDLDYGKGMKYRYFNRTSTEMTTLDPGGSHIRDKISNRLPISNGTQYTYKAVVEITGDEPLANPDQDTVPQYAKTDYVSNDAVGETYPNYDDYEYGGLIYDLSSDGYAVCKGAVGKPKVIEIPDYVIVDDEDGQSYAYTVGLICAKAFASNNNLKKVNICDQMICIEKKAFFKCKNLKTIVFEGIESLSLLENAVFKGIHKKAVFYIAADSYMFKELKSYLKTVGAPKKSKFRRVKA